MQGADKNLMQILKIKMKNDKSKLKIIKYLGVDWGEKRIGLALGDNETGIVTPLKVVSGINEIVKIINDEGVDVLVIGKPISMNYELPASPKLQRGERIMNKEFNNFVDKLNKRVSIPIEFVDERLSSKAADALAGDKKVKAPRDAVAAMIILQGYLDSINTNFL
jgi:putative Holliday junction resolvase